MKPNLLFCIHQWDSEGIRRGEGESGRLSRSEWIVGRVVRRDRKEEVSDESIEEGFEEVEVVVG